MPFRIVSGNITDMEVDAVVNAANTELAMGGGVCGAIFFRAGVKELEKACSKIGHCAVGQAVMTDGFGLKARKIIHAVGPIWQGGNRGEEGNLRRAYESALRLAAEKGLESIAFPLISAGIYGYPKEEAIRVAREAIGSFLLLNDLEVYLVLFDDSPVSLENKTLKEIRSYLELNLTRRRMQEKSLVSDLERSPSVPHEVFRTESAMESLSLDQFMEKLEASFSRRLLSLIDEKGYTDVMTYRKANIDRKLFSKIRGDEYYSPKKSTALAFVIALELNLDEALDLLGRAGYTLSPASRSDVIIEYFIMKKHYDIHEINEALYAFHEQPLGV